MLQELKNSLVALFTEGRIYNSKLASYSKHGILVFFGILLIAKHKAAFDNAKPTVKIRQNIMADVVLAQYLSVNFVGFAIHTALAILTLVLGTFYDFDLLDSWFSPMNPLPCYTLFFLMTFCTYYILFVLEYLVSLFSYGLYLADKRGAELEHGISHLYSYACSSFTLEMVDLMSNTSKLVWYRPMLNNFRYYKHIFRPGLKYCFYGFVIKCKHCSRKKKAS